MNLGAGRRWLSNFAPDIGGWMSNARERQRLRRISRALPPLSTRLLRDIGFEQFSEPPDPIIRQPLL